jgi:hypothetical protein
MLIKSKVIAAASTRRSNPPVESRRLLSTSRAIDLIFQSPLSCHRRTRWYAKEQKHTTGGIPRWSPTLVLVARFSAYVWQSGRDAQFSLTYGRMCLFGGYKSRCTLMTGGSDPLEKDFSSLQASTSIQDTQGENEFSSRSPKLRPKTRRSVEKMWFEQVISTSITSFWKSQGR